MRRFARFSTIDTIFKKLENINGEVLLSVKLQAETCNFTKINTSLWVFFTFSNSENGTKSRKA